MRKFTFFILTGILCSLKIFGQVVVTNPANTTPALAATYPTLANAITALSAITAISGPVTITLAAGNPQTAPAGGYQVQFAATATAVNNITIEGNSNIITAFTPQTAGNLNDAIFKLVGADYITIQHFTMSENATNTTTVSGTNNMTEFGVALLRASPTDGAQNNTVLDNIITLNRTYTNTFGLYSSVRHSAANITTDPITNVSGSNFGNKIYGNQFSDVNYGVVFIGSVTAAYMDNGNDIGGSAPATGNSFTNWGNDAAASGYPNLTGSNYCIFLNHQVNENVSYNNITSAIHTSINDLGGISNNFSAGQPSGTFTSTYTFNTISLSKSASSGSVYGINIRGISPALSTATININNNLINNIAVTGAGSSSSITGVANSSACGVLNMNGNTVRGCTSTGITPAAGFTGIENTGAVVNNININNNKIGDAVSGAISYSVASTSAMYGIKNTQHPVTCSVSISTNDIRGIVHSIGSASSQVYIGNIAIGQVGNVVINGNTFTNLSVNTSNAIIFIARQGQMTATSTAQCSNNGIVGSFTNNYAGATPAFMYFYFVESLPYSQSVNGSVVSVTGNNFSNVTVNGAVSIQGYYDLEGLSNSNAPTKTYTGNVMNNIIMGTGTIYAMYISNGGGVVCSTNVVSNISTGGFIAGIWFSSTNGQGPDHLSNNTVTNLASGTANVVGIMAGSLAVPSLTVSGNTVTGLSSTGTTNVQLVGIEIIQGQTILINNNTISNMQSSGVGPNTFAYGIRVNTGTAVQVYQNKIYDIRHVGAATSTVSAVVGIYSLNPANLTAYNNFVADLKAPNSGQADAIRGININALGANTTYKLYYNSVYINATSSGINFGTSGIYHTGNATATTGRLEMINNIIVNTSTENGTGITAAFRRSNTTLNNYAAASDFNLLYAGTPSATKLIYYDGTNTDQTVGAFQTTVSPRDANDLSLMPDFVSAIDLHLKASPLNCPIDDKGTPIAGITDDIDAELRSTTTPDIGADEFTALNNTTLAGIVGTAVCNNKPVLVAGTIYSSACNLIATVVPAGADPVTGMLNACVTLDATQQYFNGEPYLQRHYDLEPVVSNQTTTSATITLYFTDTEFQQYNLNNVVWPQMPTAVLGNADPNRANVRITQFHGAATTSPSSPGNYPGTRLLITPTLPNIFWNGAYWSITFDITGFSGFYAHTTLTNAPLPIMVNFLNGRKQGSSHVLDWKVTCVSTPKATMILERSSDARNYTGIYTIAADAARCAQPFDYTDTNPLKGMNYYRLKIADADGKITYSTTVALLNAVKGFDIISIAPNPVVSNNFKLNVASAQAGKMNIVIFDMQGRLVNKQTLSLIAGYNSLSVDVSNLAKGTYTIRSGMDEESSKVMRFVKQ